MPFNREGVPKYRTSSPTEASQSDATVVVKVADLINMAMGPTEKNKVNFKMIQTILHILARNMRLLDQQVELRSSDITQPQLSTKGRFKASRTESKDREKAAETAKGKEKADIDNSQDREETERDIIKKESKNTASPLSSSSNMDELKGTIYFEKNKEKEESLHKDISPQGRFKASRTESEDREKAAETAIGKEKADIDNSQDREETERDIIKKESKNTASPLSSSSNMAELKGSIYFEKNREKEESQNKEKEKSLHKDKGRFKASRTESEDREIAAETAIGKEKADIDNSQDREETENDIMKKESKNTALPLLSLSNMDELKGPIYFEKYKEKEESLHKDISPQGRFKASRTESEDREKAAETAKGKEKADRDKSQDREETERDTIKKESKNTASPLSSSSNMDESMGAIYFEKNKEQQDKIEKFKLKKIREVYLHENAIKEGRYKDKEISLDEKSPSWESSSSVLSSSLTCDSSDDDENQMLLNYETERVERDSKMEQEEKLAKIAKIRGKERESKQEKAKLANMNDEERDKTLKEKVERKRERERERYKKTKAKLEKLNNKKRESECRKTDTETYEVEKSEKDSQLSLEKKLAKIAKIREVYLREKEREITNLPNMDDKEREQYLKDKDERTGFEEKERHEKEMTKLPKMNESERGKYLKLEEKEEKEMTEDRERDKEKEKESNKTERVNVEEREKHLKNKEQRDREKLDTMDNDRTEGDKKNERDKENYLREKVESEKAKFDAIIIEKTDSEKEKKKQQYTKEMEKFAKNSNDETEKLLRDTKHREQSNLDALDIERADREPKEMVKVAPLMTESEQYLKQKEKAKLDAKNRERDDKDKDIDRERYQKEMLGLENMDDEKREKEIKDKEERGKANFDAQEKKTAEKEMVEKEKAKIAKLNNSDRKKYLNQKENEERKKEREQGEKEQENEREKKQQKTDEEYEHELEKEQKSPGREQEHETEREYKHEKEPEKGRKKKRETRPDHRPERERRKEHEKEPGKAHEIERAKEREKERKQEPEKEPETERENERKNERENYRKNERENERENVEEKQQEKERDKERDKEHDKERNKEREKKREKKLREEREKERDEEREKELDKGQENERDKERKKEPERERDRKREHEMERELKRERTREIEREKGQEKEKETKLKDKEWAKAGSGARTSHVDSGTRVGSIEVVTRSEFELLEAKVKELQEKTDPIPYPSMPDNQKLRTDLARGSASLTDTMQAMQVSARVQATETAMSRMADLLTQLAAAGALPQDVVKQVGEVTAGMDRPPSGETPGGVDTSKRSSLFRGELARRSIGTSTMRGLVGPSSATVSRDGGDESSRSYGSAMDERIRSVGISPPIDETTRSVVIAEDGLSRHTIGTATSTVGVDRRKYSGGPTTASRAHFIRTCVTHPELDDAQRDLKDKMIKRANEMVLKALRLAEIADVNVQKVSDQMEIATRVAARINVLFGLVNDYAEQLSGFDAGVSMQLQNFNEQIFQIRCELNDGVVLFNKAITNPETEAVRELNARYEELVMDLDVTRSTLDRLGYSQNAIGDEFTSLLNSIEAIREQKADRDELMDGIRDKADQRCLEGLIKDLDFEPARIKLEQRLDDCYEKFKRQEDVWMKALEDLNAFAESKASGDDLFTFTYKTEIDLNKLKDELQLLTSSLGEPKAILLTRKISEGGTCGPCQTPANQAPTAGCQPPLLPAMGRHLPIAEEPCTQLVKEPRQLGEREHICKRWTGGSHTLINKNVVYQDSGDIRMYMPPTKKYAGVGNDGKLYQLEELLQPCADCNQLGIEEETKVQEEGAGEPGVKKMELNLK